MVPIEKLSCKQLEEKILEVSRSHKKYFYLGYTETVSSYLQSTGPKSEEWRELKKLFLKETVHYSQVTARHLVRFSEQRLIDQYRKRLKCLNESPQGKHRPGVVYVVVYTLNRAAQQRGAMWGGGAARVVQDPWKNDLLLQIKEIKEMYQDRAI
ncbi:hypothetical protein DR999_PMT22746 [Platysternon megacephalum]|uniref:Uncharacterized protein n=1 Tax=Platysternon megacephalum TaxID=55544 RepID=A0A4D9DDX8_9SAUR|nr:hypothetical protein DR999_PMT22746 [Platysternon megacephalum]